MKGGRLFGNGRLLLAAILAAAAVLFAMAASQRERIVVVALDAEEAAALCAKTGYPIGDFWERAKAVGVAAAILREEPLSALIDRGDVLHFTGEELEKWKAVGLIAPGSPLKADALWIRDQTLSERLLEAASRRSIAVSTSSSAGYHIVEFPGRVDTELGLYDPATVRALPERGLAPIYAGTQAFPFSRVRAALRWNGEATPQGWWGTEETGPCDAVLDPRDWRIGSGLAALLEVVYGSPKRLVIAHLSSSLSLEQNFDLLRAARRELDRRGVSLSLPMRPPPPIAPGPLAEGLCFFFVWTLGVGGPLLAAWAGLRTLRRVRAIVLERWPQAAPELPLVAGLFAQAAAAAALGLAVRGFAAYLPSTPGSAWSFWVMAGPVLIAALTVYRLDLAQWRRRLARPITPARLAWLFALLAAAALLLKPRAVLDGTGLLSRLEGLNDVPAALWWWPLRWREMAVGVPCYFLALLLIHRRLDAPAGQPGGAAPPSAGRAGDQSMGSPAVAPSKTALPPGRSAREFRPDPRAYFLPGLLAPAGAIVALGRAAIPVGAALAQSGWVLLIGAAFGWLMAAARLAWSRRPVRGARSARAANP